MDTTSSLNSPAPGQVAAPRVHKGSLIAGLVGGGLVAAALIGISAERGSKPAEPVAAAPVQATPAAEAAKPAEAPAKPAATETVEAPKPAAKPAPVAKAPAPKAAAPVQVAAAPQPSPAAAVPDDPAQARLARLCNGCAVVERITSEERKGEASMVGTIGGAVVGGLLGNQVGGGTGRKIATVGGAVAGGYAGREIEKNVNKKTVWITEVTFKDGSSRRFEQASEPGWRRDDVVELRDGRLVLAR